MKRRRGALTRRYGRAIVQRMCPAGSQVQTLLFPMPKFNLESAKAWAKKHGWKTGDVDIGERFDFIHLRQEDPARFRRVRTIHFGGSGVMARVGWVKC